MSGPPISIAFAAAVEAIAFLARVTPLRGLHVVENDRWKLTINAQMEPVESEGQTLGPFELMAESKIYLAFISMNPLGGAVGGMREDQFIEEMNAIAQRREPA